MNNIKLTGNLIKDSELTYLPTGTAKLSFVIAVNDGYGDNKKTYFVPVTVWGKSAESLADKLIKGTRLLVSGKLTITNYEDKQGNKRSFTEVVADRYEGVEFIGAKKSGVDDTKAGEMFNDGGLNEEYTPVDDGDMPF